MPHHRTSTWAIAASLAAAVVLSGCAPTDSAGTAPADDGASGSDVFPTTIEHKFGETELTEAPSRVVTVGLVEQDALLALGVAPVGVTEWFGDAEGRIFPWAEDAFAETGAELPTVLDSTDGIPVEEVAGLEPDLIIGLYSAMTQEEYDLLSQIAPTIAQPEGQVDYGASWDESTLTIGQAVGLPDAAAEIVDTVNAQIDDAAAAHPEFEGEEAVVVAPYDGLFVYGPDDPRGRILSRLGFEFPAALEEGRTEDFGWSISSERVSDLDGIGAVVWIGLGTADAGTADLWSQTATAQEGRFLDISDADGPYYVAQSMVTPLSIPYVLERYVPQLAAAVDGDPATTPPAVTE